MARRDKTTDDSAEPAPRPTRRRKRDLPVDRKAWGFDPHLGLESIKMTMASLLSDLFSRRGSAEHPLEPPVDLFEEDGALVVLMNLPGTRREDVRLHAYESLLIIRGQTGAPDLTEKRAWHLRERAVGPFHRAIPLPYPIQAEGIRASLRDGLLRVVLPLEGKQAVRSVEIEID
ncbi:MAG: Hsp20/alpha crystallin family protein [Proteobacteria bacterium]|nr:Hsp20/alpha crystallin family protein [Pseudomonadota bacterium]